MSVTTNNPFSFEFFPPRTEQGEASLRTVRSKLQPLAPAYFSVTYGAGGSTREPTINTVIDIQNNDSCDAAAHLTCVGSSKAHIASLLDHYRANGVKRIVALRGDLPSDQAAEPSELQYANELVEFIRQHSGDFFTIEIAAYPECHPQALSPQSDLDSFRRKVEAGANSAITQYFYNRDSYFAFVEQSQRLGIDIAIVPGIMPITNYTQLARFSDACGAEIPRWIRQRLESYGDDLSSIRAFGLEVVSQLAQQLLDGGAPGLHFYTMNKAEPTLAIINNLK